jgi:hypothetical protein
LPTNALYRLHGLEKPTPVAFDEHFEADVRELPAVVVDPVPGHIAFLGDRSKGAPQRMQNALKNGGLYGRAVIPQRGDKRRELHGFKPSWPIACFDLC